MKVSLDRSIGETLRFLHGEIQCPPNIVINRTYGLPTSFHFEHSDGSNIPIEHLGLAILCYKKAVDTFYMKEVIDKQHQDTYFEPLPEGQHVADCLTYFSKDVLAWYKNSRGQSIKLITLPECFITKPELYMCNKYFDTSDFLHEQQNFYRIETIGQAVGEALHLYQNELTESGLFLADEIDKAHIHEICCLATTINKMWDEHKNAFPELPKVEDPNQEQ